MAADTVHGRVHDVQGRPIAGAEIIVEDIGRLVTSNRNGEFIIDAPPRATLVIRHAGFAPGRAQ
jgi:hypothetical protein